jgi:hypothetical protein
MPVTVAESPLGGGGFLKIPRRPSGRGFVPLAAFDPVNRIPHQRFQILRAGRFESAQFLVELFGDLVHACLPLMDSTNSTIPDRVERIESAAGREPMAGKLAVAVWCWSRIL